VAKLPKMNPAVREKWLTALESGEYEQGDGYLCKHDSDGKTRHCCWGVLSEIAAKEGIVRKSSPVDWCIGYGDNPPSADITDPDAETDAKLAVRYPPRKVLDWAGIDPDQPAHLGVPPTVNKLADFNDGGKSFRWIAAYIRRYL
jgi:hypothetical protein